MTSLKSIEQEIVEEFSGTCGRSGVEDLLSRYRQALRTEVEKIRKEEDWRKINGGYEAAEKVREADRNYIFNNAVNRLLSLLSE